MAKLSAHGFEVARLDITRTVPDHEYRVVYSFRSDGHILRRLGSDGWKLYKRLKNPHPATTRGRMVALADAWAADAEARSDSTIENVTVNV